MNESHSHTRSRPRSPKSVHAVTGAMVFVLGLLAFLSVGAWVVLGWETKAVTHHGQSKCATQTRGIQQSFVAWAEGGHTTRIREDVLLRTSSRDMRDHEETP